MDVISFYDNGRKEFIVQDNLMMSMYDKKKLKLDLTNKVKKQDNSNALLTSPDVELLKLDSPELERIILATAGSATPTPKQYRRGKGTSDLSVKEQQEQYVRGFEDALNKMRQEATTPNSAITSTVSNIITNNNNITKIVHDSVAGLNGGLYSFNTVAPSVSSTPFPSTSVINTTTNFGTISTQDLGLDSLRNETNRTRSLDSVKPHIEIVHTKGSNDVEPDDITAAHLLVEPTSATADSNSVNIGQNVSEHSVSSLHVSTTTSSSPLSTVPIDLQEQEIVKSERKKHRNRVAASKCRKRKLERESNLQETVNKLKTRNMELSEIAATLRQQVCELKLQVMGHVKSGCEVLLKNQPIQTT